MKNQHNFLYRFGAMIFRRLIFRVKAEGLENVPESGAVVFCANHTSKADPVIIATLIGRKFKTMAKKEAFGNHLAGAVISRVGAFPVDRSGNDIGAIKYSISVLQSGGALCVFPQGTRRPYLDPRNTNVHDGVGMFAARTNAKIVPICIQTKHMKVKPFQKTYVTIGKPISCDECALTGNRAADYKIITEYAFARICDMMKEDRTDRSSLRG